MRRRKPRRAGPAHFGGEGRGGKPAASPTGEIATEDAAEIWRAMDEATGELKVRRDRIDRLTALLEEAAREPCRGRATAPRPCPELPGYSHALWCFPCKARETLEDLNA